MAWTVVVPVRTSVRAPALPASLLARIPRTTPRASVLLGNPGPQITSYGAFRAAFPPYWDPKFRGWDAATAIGSVYQ